MVADFLATCVPYPHRCRDEVATRDSMLPPLHHRHFSLLNTTSSPQSATVGCRCRVTVRRSSHLNIKLVEATVQLAAYSSCLSIVALQPQAVGGVEVLEQQQLEDEVEVVQEEQEV
ncbi:hypothetical protein FHG87_017513 [Trinorchestia longiramus]|nr:hypothetical protein FHG87_017513 [Trinorchestia longiramus]